MKSPIDLSSVIRLELRNKHGHKLNSMKLKSISRILAIDFDHLQLLNGTCKRIWFIPDGIKIDLICAVYDSSDVYEIPPIFFSGFETPSQEILKALLSMDPTDIFEMDKKEVDSNKGQIPTPKSKAKSPKKEKLDVDTILDKINETGMDSLTSRELEFLNSLSK